MGSALVRGVGFEPTVFLRRGFKEAEFARYTERNPPSPLFIQPAPIARAKVKRKGPDIKHDLSQHQRMNGASWRNAGRLWEKGKFNKYLESK